MNLTTIIYALLAGIIPTFIWLIFWLREDNIHPEPRRLIALSFLAGCLSVIIAIIFEKFAQDVISNTAYKYMAWAGIEEILKFIAVAIVALNSKYLDEPIDAMIYCITVALGFAALENALFILSPLHAGELTTTIVTGNLRFIGATLVHVVSSASIGFMIGLSFYRGKIIKTLSIAIGIILSMALHASFNLAIINSTTINTLKVFGGVWFAVVILIILFEEVKAVKPKTTQRIA
ncbi:MAG TPA: PrsW family intramembrane metalloprotease [Candidatus Paceibacterota bacterium]